MCSEADHCFRLLTRDRWEVVQELLDRVVVFEVVEECLHWDTAVAEAGGPVHPFRINPDVRIHRARWVSLLHGVIIGGEARRIDRYCKLVYASIVSVEPRISFFLDWPSIVAIAAPAILGWPTGWLVGDWVWILSPIICIAGIATGAAASYGVSCRVADRAGQPWAYLSFFASLASWLMGLYLMFYAVPLFK